MEHSSISSLSMYLKFYRNYLPQSISVISALADVFLETTHSKTVFNTKLILRKLDRWCVAEVRTDLAPSQADTCISILSLISQMK